MKKVTKIIVTLSTFLYLYVSVANADEAYISGYRLTYPEYTSITSMTNHVSDTDSYTEFYLDDCQVVVRGDVISKAGECEDVKFEKAPIQGRYGNIIINRVDGSMNIYSDE